MPLIFKRTRRKNSIFLFKFKRILWKKWRKRLQGTHPVTPQGKIVWQIQAILSFKPFKREDYMRIRRILCKIIISIVIIQIHLSMRQKILLYFSLIISQTLSLHRKSLQIKENFALKLNEFLLLLGIIVK